jgi:non-homologous end joining protein Ku
MSEQTARRAVASNITFTIAGSFVQLQADLLSAKPTDKTDFTSLCPDCTEPTAVSERYICKHEDAHGPYSRNELRKGREIDKMLYRAEDADIEAIKATTITKDEAVAVRVFPSAEVTNHVRPTGSSYLLRPLGKAQLAYAALTQFVGDPKLAFLCEVLVRGSQKLYRIEAWNGQLVLQELIRPNELAETETIVAPVTKEMTAMLKQIIVNGTEKAFDPQQFRALTPERVAELDARLVSSGDGKEVTKGKQPSVNGGDLLSALQASLEKGNMNGSKKVARPKKAKVTPIKKAS